VKSRSQKSSHVGHKCGVLCRIVCVQTLAFPIEHLAWGHVIGPVLGLTF